jgi:hypothetical protein
MAPPVASPAPITTQTLSLAMAFSFAPNLSAAIGRLKGDYVMAG